jgi:hypothetical protein
MKEYYKKKTPGGFPFFQWIRGFRGLSSTGRCFMVKLMGITNLTFSNKEKLIFIEIGWGEKN